MLIDRCLRISVKETIKSLFEGPPTESGLSAFNVYSETDMRDMNKGKLMPEAPYIFITDSRIAPTTAQLPFIAIDATPSKEPFELGNEQGRRIAVDLHIFGKSRGERDDLASFIADYLKTITIENHNSSGSYLGYAAGATMCVGEIVSDAKMSYMDISEEESLEGSLENWTILNFEFLSKY